MDDLLPSDWPVWSIDKPAECWEFYLWLHSLAPTALPTDPLLFKPAAPPPARPKRRVRRPGIASTAKQLWKAARDADVSIALTVEGGKVIATPVKGTAVADSDINEWDRDLGTNPPSLRQ